MDASDTRRGLPAAHRRFATLHRGNGWVGSPESFGTGAAILLGDLCLSWADELLFGSGLPAEALLRAKPVFDVMRTELMAGQYLDLAGAGPGRRLGRPRHDAWCATSRAKYTIERPLHLGGALAGADPALLAAYSAYGLPLGEAFQLRDDVLGVFGDPAADRQAGRRRHPRGQAHRAGGHRARAVPTGRSRRCCAGTSATRTSPRTDVAAVRAAITGTGALEQVEKLIDELTDQALHALDRAELVPAARDVLARAGPRRDRAERVTAVPRSVTGPTDHVVVVGAGLGGLSCALHLAGAGRRVTVLEREPVPGGRAGLLESGGYRFDTGPTVLTMPDLVADALRGRGRGRSPTGWTSYASIRATGPTTRTARPWTYAPTPRHRRRGRAGVRAGRGRGIPALRRLRDRAVPLRDGRLHRPQHRLPARAAHPEPRAARRARRVPSPRTQGRRAT